MTRRAPDLSRLDVAYADGKPNPHRREYIRRRLLELVRPHMPPPSNPGAAKRRRAA